jgi:hypothetical protein
MLAFAQDGPLPNAEGPGPTGQPRTARDPAWDPLKASPELRKLFEVWSDTDLKAQLVVFYHNNPGVIETVEGLARRLGIQPTALRQALLDPVHMGLLQERKLGDKVVLVYNAASTPLQEMGEDAVRKKMEGST